MKSSRKKRSAIEPDAPQATGPKAREVADVRSASGRPLLLIELFTNNELEGLYGLGRHLGEFCLIYPRNLGLPCKFLLHNLSENPGLAVQRDVSVLPAIDITDHGKSRRFLGNLDTFKSVIQAFAQSAVGRSMKEEAEEMKRAARKMLD